jgi:hypothetical protein
LGLVPQICIPWAGKKISKMQCGRIFLFCLPVTFKIGKGDLIVWFCINNVPVIIPVMISNLKLIDVISNSIGGEITIAVVN